MRDQPRGHADDAAKLEPSPLHDQSAAPDEDATLAFASEDDIEMEAGPARDDSPISLAATIPSRFRFDGADRPEPPIFPAFREEVAAGDQSFPSRFARARDAILRPGAVSIVAGAVVLVALYFLVSRTAQTGAPAGDGRTGAATINSRPEGLEVTIDGEVRGTTPLKLELPLGDHTLVIRAGTEERSMPLAIEAGTVASHYVDLGAATPGTGRSTGRLEVTSEPPGSTVRLDGAAVGTTPLMLPTVAAGEHQIVVGAGDTAVTRTVTVRPGATASIAASFGPPSSRGGWVSFKLPFEAQVLEDGRLIGTTAMDRVMLPTGRHQLELVNTPLEFRTTASVVIAAGRTVAHAVTVPRGTLSVNALPWADVAIDGAPVGTTPLANISLTLGSHELVFTHPQRGERRRTIVITAGAPARIAVDFGQ